MTNNPFRIKPIKIKPIDIYGSQRSSKRTLGRRDRDALYLKAKGRCEGCGKKISQPEMQVGHRRAWSRGGATTFANSACLCWTCNKMQGTGSLETLKKKLAGTYGKRTKTRTRKTTKKRTSGGQTWINPLTGKKEKFNPFGI
jgi:5-methylcytosine-specific restriction endonuclease McrA